MKSETKKQILNLASDLRRISWWACDEKDSRDALIERFLDLVKKDRRLIGRKLKVNEIVEKEFLSDWPRVKHDRKKKLVWAEKVLTSSLRLKHLAF